MVMVWERGLRWKRICWTWKELDSQQTTSCFPVWAPHWGFRCGSKLIRGTLVNNLSPPHPLRGCPLEPWLANRVPDEVRLRIRNGGLVLWQAFRSACLIESSGDGELKLHAQNTRGDIGEPSPT
jgi:hypothetical protein